MYYLYFNIYMYKRNKLFNAPKQLTQFNHANWLLIRNFGKQNT